MKTRPFNNIKVSEQKYVVNKKLPIDVKYQLRNGQVLIDLKDVIDGILDEECIGKYKTEKVSLNVPFDINKQVSGNSINLVIDKKRFTLRLQALEIIPSKQQKIDYDNTHAHRWKIPQWIKLIEDLFYQTYGFKAMELDVRSNAGSVRRGKLFGNIKAMKTKILDAKGFNFTEKDVVEYLRWAFAKKGSRANISIGLLQSDSLIQEWLISKKKNKTIKKKVRKWDG